MKKPILFGLFLLVAAAQLAAPLTLIVRHESTLRTGEQFKFRTRPIDPYDAMRGRYVYVSPEDREAPLAAGETALGRGGTVYVRLKKDADGFARALDASAARPREGAYVRAQVQYSSGNGKVAVTWPFERYFVEESIAPRAEEVYRQHATRNPRDAWLVVRVKDGWTVTEDLIVGGKPIREAIRNAAKP